ncbi:MAG TPA: BsuPI-related putative proteinase inhibitor [Gemmatimonadota bacterium]|nr:BsuPI-related putative proteinase inhibitor [Gemmatimonadota bacterium]
MIPTAPFPSTVERDGVVFEARFTAQRPDVLDVDVTLFNRTDSPRTIRFPDSCEVLLRAYFPTGRRVWDQLEREKSCRNVIQEVRLAPGETRVFDEQVGSLGILGFTLPEGEYRITAYMRPLDHAEVELDLGIVPLERPTSRRE